MRNISRNLEKTKQEQLPDSQKNQISSAKTNPVSRFEAHALKIKFWNRKHTHTHICESAHIYMQISACAQAQQHKITHARDSSA